MKKDEFEESLLCELSALRCYALSLTGDEHRGGD